MSGYLTNLIMRTFEPTVEVQPQLTPLFGPPSVGPGWLVPSPVDEAEAKAEENERVAPTLPAPSASTIEQTSSPLTLAHASPTRPLAELGESEEQRLQEEHTVRALPISPVVRIASSRRELSGETRRREPEFEGPHRNPDAQKNTSPVAANDVGHPVQAGPSKTENMAAGQSQSPDSVPARAHATRMEPAILSNTIHLGMEATAEPTILQRYDSEQTPMSIPGPSLSMEMGRLRQDIDSFYSRAASLSLEEAGSVEEMPRPQKPVAVTGSLLRRAQEVHSTPPSATQVAQVRQKETIPAEQVAQSPQPTIQVTIGRIEVRAASPGQAAKKSQAPTRTLGLDEYLRRRSGRSQG
jgi:hypothetical protein